MGSLREQLNDIRVRRGELNPPVVVEEASDPAHPLHSHFEWDDTIAGHKYRLSQAAELLRVTFVPKPGAPEIRAFWPVRDGTPTTSYEPIEDVLADDIQRELLLRTMRREFEGFRNRYKHMAEYAELVKQAATEAAS